MPTLRPAAGVLLALTLGAPAGFAAPPRATVPATRQGAAESGSLLLQLRDFLLRLWSPAGCEIDPLGRCLQGTKAAPPHPLTAAEGCEWDPLGRCLQGTKPVVQEPPSPSAGCEMDPLGRCITQPY